jgi:formylglycine-generating enzyme required for sulfatase activity
MSSRIPAGTFLMGSPVTEPDRRSDEAQHEVTLTEDFYMSRYEITNAEYAAFLNDTGVDETGEGTVDGFGLQTLVEAYALMGVIWDGSAWQPTSGRATCPVIKVTWYGAKAFADWAGMSLPTEAQWEYACRAGTTTTWYFGNDPAVLGEYAWFASNAAGYTRPVGGKKPNPWGLYDMHGNALEWCADWYEADYLSLPTSEDPKGALSGSSRVVRGGNWGNAAQYNRSAWRTHYPPGTSGVSSMGFRVVFVH